MYKYQFTVFTPTYNRADTLSRVYNSLKKQTFKEFEWLIVDDGSTDNTKDLVSEWMRDSQFPIRYIYQENAGKLSAINNGVKNAQGEFFLIADSDDTFVPDALQILFDAWQGIDNKDEFSSVVALCEDSKTGEIVGDRFPEDVFDSNTLEIVYKYSVDGEKWGFIRTDVLKEYPFPVLDNEKYIPEGTVWNRIARKYKARFINRIVRIYYQNEGVSLSSALLKHPQGVFEYILSELNENYDYLLFEKTYFLVSVVNLARMAVYADIPIVTVLKKICRWQVKSLYCILFPLALLVVFRDFIRKIRE